MEQFPSPEKAKISKEEVIQRLKEGGADDESAKEFFVKWLDQEQAEAAMNETARTGLELNVRVAEVYRDAGMVEAAIEAFEQAAEQAFQERDDELCKKLQDEADRLRGDKG